MQRLEVSCAVRRIYTSLGAKGLNLNIRKTIKMNRAKTFLFYRANKNIKYKERQ